MATAQHEEDILKTNALAQQAASDEHDLGVREAIRRYPRAIMWSVLVSTAIISMYKFIGLPL